MLLTVLFDWRQGILDATVINYERFRMVTADQPNLRLVDVENWAGLGAVQ